MVARVSGQIYNVEFGPPPAAESVELERLVFIIQAHLDETGYMRLPAGCGDRSGKIVMYGLRQAPSEIYVLGDCPN